MPARGTNIPAKGVDIRLNPGIMHGKNGFNDSREMSPQSALFFRAQATVAMRIAIHTVGTDSGLNGLPILFVDFHGEFLLGRLLKSKNEPQISAGSL
jgi:hypothetical protein